jgi:hypothetical protein
MGILQCIVLTSFLVVFAWIWIRPRTTACDAYTAGYQEATLVACRRHGQRMRQLRDRLASLEVAVPAEVTAAIELSMQVRVRQSCSETDDLYSCERDAHFPIEGEYMGTPALSSCYARDSRNNGSVVMWMMEPEEWHEEYLGTTGTLRVNRCTDPRAHLFRPFMGMYRELDYNFERHITLPDGETQCRSPMLWWRIGPSAIDTDMEKPYETE